MAQILGFLKPVIQAAHISRIIAARIHSIAITSISIARAALLGTAEGGDKIPSNAFFASVVGFPS